MSFQDFSTLALKDYTGFRYFRTNASIILYLEYGHGCLFKWVSLTLEPAKKREILKLAFE